MFAGLLLALTMAAAPVPAVPASAPSTLVPAASASAPLRPAPLPPTPRFRHYDVASGLPSNRVYRTVEGANGYVWVGTGDGLARFDGTHFKIFRHAPRDPSSLPGNDIEALLVDRDGHLWVGGEGTGLNRYDPATGGFRHWLHRDGEPGSISGNDVLGLAQTSDGTLWVAVYAGGVGRLSADGTRFTFLRHHDGDPTGLASDKVVALHADAQGRLWIGSNRGVDLRTPDGRIHHIAFAGVSKHLWAWQIDGEGDDVRVATSVGLFVIGRDLVARRLPRMAQFDDAVYSSFRSGRGGLWVGVRGGLRLLAADGRNFMFKTRRLMPGGLPSRLVLNMTRDHEGGMWLSTEEAGLLYLGPQWRDFTTFGHVPEDAASLQDSRILALFRQTDGQLLVGGSDGELDRLDPATGAVEHLGASMGVPKKSVNALLVDRTGDLWIGQERRLRVLRAGQLHVVGAGVLNNGPVWLVQGSDGDIYAAGTGQGVFRIDPASLKMAPVALAGAGEHERETRALVLHDGALWRASAAGLSRMALGSATLRYVPGVARGLVEALAFHGHDLWLARLDALEHYRIDAGHVQLVARFPSATGWPVVSILRLVIDADGRVWATSRVGLWRFDPRRRSVRRYGVADGLPSPAFDRALLAGVDGRVYAGTLGGVVAFRPRELRDRPQPPRLLLTTIQATRDGRPHALTRAGGAYRIGWRDRDLRVAVKALSYINPQRNHYRFRMRGVDAGWVSTGSRGEREFAALPAGKYTLDVQAAGPSGAWASLAQPLALRVMAPPWDRPLAWLAYALLLALAVWLAWRVARRRVEQHVHLRMIEQASAAKTRFLATLGHEIRTPMTGVLGMAELLTHTDLDARQRGFVGAIERSGSVLLKLVNDALDLARIETGRMPLDAEPFDPAALLREVAALDAGLAAGKGLALHVEVAADVPHWVLGDAVRVKQIVLNLTGNALKFTDRGSVWLTLATRDRALVYRVRDSGPGLADADRSRLFRRFEQGTQGSGSGGSGLGLAICRELASLMGGSVEVESRPGAGSTFVAILPLPVAVRGPAAAAVAPASGHYRILLVEDDPVVGEVILGLLQARGHTVKRVAQALAAMSEVAVATYDVAMVDLDLPDLDGFELIRILREGGHPLRAIIVVTARTERSDERKARAAGADGFLRKPVSGEQLAAALAAAVTTQVTAAIKPASDAADPE